MIPFRFFQSKVLSFPEICNGKHLKNGFNFTILNGSYPNRATDPNNIKHHDVSDGLITDPEAFQKEGSINTKIVANLSISETGTMFSPNQIESLKQIELAKQVELREELRYVLQSATMSTFFDADNYIVAGHLDGGLTFWRSGENKPAFTFKSTELEGYGKFPAVQRVHMTPYGQVSVFYDKELVCFQLAQEIKNVKQYPLPDDAQIADASRGVTVFVSKTGIEFVNAVKARTEWAIPGKYSGWYISFFKVSLSGDMAGMVLCSDKQMQFHVMDLKNRTVVRTFTTLLEDADFHCASFYEKDIIAGMSTGALYLLTGDISVKPKKLPVFEASVCRVAMNSRWIVAVDSGNQVAVIDREKVMRKENDGVKVVEGLRKETIHAMALQGDQLILGFSDGHIESWNCASRTRSKELCLHTMPVSEIVPDGEALWSRSLSEAVKLPSFFL